MEQTRRGRACELEMNRFRSLIENMTPPEEDSSSRILYEDTSDATVSIYSIVHSGVQVIDECTSTFSVLLQQVNSLVQEAVETYLPGLLLYEDHATTTSADECSSIRSMTAFMPFLYRLSQFVSRVYLLFRSLIQQIRAFHSLQPSELPAAEERRLTLAWRGLGDLLSILMHIDEIATHKKIIRQHWQSYIRALETAHHSPSQFGATEDDLRRLIGELVGIEGLLMAGNTLRNCYEQSLGELDEDVSFANRMKDVLMEMFERWQKTAESDVPDKRRLTIIVCLTVYYQLHFQTKEKKLIKAVWSSHKKIAAFHLVGDILWIPCAFIAREVPEVAKIVDKKSMLFVKDIRTQLENEQGAAMLEEAVAHVEVADNWMKDMRMEKRKEGARSMVASLELVENMLRGARISDSMCRLLKTVLNSLPHEGSTITINKATANKVFLVVETIKAMASTFSSLWRPMLDAASIASQQWRCRLLSHLDKYRVAMRDGNDQYRMAAFQLAVDVMLSTASQTRLTVCGVALEMAQYKKIMSSADCEKVEGLIGRLDTLSKPRRLLQRVTDCSFLVFHRSFIRIYWDTVLSRMPEIGSIESFANALTDCAFYVTKSCHSENATKDLLNEVYDGVNKGLLLPLCDALENDLRVLSHKHLEVDERDKTPREKADYYKQLMKYPRIQVYDMIIDMKDAVARHLEKTFYNMTVVALHDCHTYSRMAALAQQRYGIPLIDGHVPHHTIDEGLDVIHVMRTLSQFVTGYNYCLNQQLFIEKESPNRTLRVLTSQHMASSIRTHGIGVLNTCVNITYQLLRKKLNVFNQFLSDEHIKAQLQRDIRYFEENRVELNKMFPVQRAERFNRAMSKLSQAEDEVTYMDKFRILITQMGNALGYVRTMASGAASVGSQMKEYDTVCDAEADFLPLEDGEQGPSSTIRQLLEDLRSQNSRNRNYIKMLVEVFASGFSDARFEHLSQLYILLPSLTSNYVEHMLMCRERLKKRTQLNKEMTFTDDGFVMGVAYLMTVLKVWPQFTALNWFKSIFRKCATESGQLKEELAASKDSRGTSLKVARLQAYEKEFKLLSYTLQSARVFFSSGDFSE